MSASKVRAGQAYVEIGADPRKLFAALGKLNAQVGKIGKSMVSMGGRMTAIGAAIGAPVGMAMRQFAGFDDAIRATAAVSGATGDALQSLNDTARTLGATTSFTAIQVANLMTELGRAGFKPDEIERMTGAVLDLARATGTDATLASGIMAATLRQFGLGASEAARAADVLTKAANATFNTVEGLGESLKYAGPVAKSLGMSLEDTVAVLGVLGNVGIQGSEAGTALRRLSVIAAGSGEELQKIFGITNTDAAGNLKPLVDILDEINQVTANMPVAERTAKMAEAFGLLGITSANVLSASADGVRGLADSLRDAEGTAAKAAKAMDAGLGGAIRITLSAIEGTALAIGDALAPSMQALVQQIGDVAGGLTAFIKANQEMIVAAAKGIAIFTGLGVAIMLTGKAIAITSGLLAVTGAVLAALSSPLGLIAAALVGFVGSALAFSGALGDMAGIARTAFGGIYDAIVDGDLSGAMDILWAGLYAGWLRGVEAIMGAVDPWVSMFQNTFTYLGTTIATTWEAMWSGLSQGANTIGAVVMGVVDNLVNGVMAAFDRMVAAVRKSWNWVQSFIVKGYDLAKENEKVDNEMAARARKREQERPGVKGRMQRAAEQNAQTASATQDRIDAMNRNADETAAGREQENRRRADQRRAETQAAEQNVASKSKAASANRTNNAQFADLLKNIEAASSISQLQDLYGEFDALSANGRLTSAQQDTLQTALDDAQERISKASSQMGGSANRVDPRAVGSAASGAAESQSEVAGTFSAMAAAAMGFGQSLAQKQLDALKQIEQNTRPTDDGLVTA